MQLECPRHGLEKGLEPSRRHPGLQRHLLLLLLEGPAPTQDPCVCTARVMAPHPSTPESGFEVQDCCPRSSGVG